MTDPAPPFRMPAEREPHRATWLSWPHNRETWPEDDLEVVEQTLAEAVRHLTRGEEVYVNVLDGEHARHVLRVVGEPHARRVRCFPIETNDAWVRDHGPLFVFDEHGRPAALDYRFDAWGQKYPPWDADDRAGAAMALAANVPVVRRAWVLEGGALDVDGAGLLLTTEACLLEAGRNPGVTREDWEREFATYLGARKTLWLGDGIAGDDTDGHVDDVARFVAPGHVVTAAEPDPQDVNHAPLRDNLARLRRMTDLHGHPLRVDTLPMPAPVEARGQRLPASYLNFYVGNRVVLLPTFGDARDAAARDALQLLFPLREVVGIDCRRLVWGLGAFHCLTQQVPR